MTTPDPWEDLLSGRVQRLPVPKIVKHGIARALTKVPREESRAFIQTLREIAQSATGSEKADALDDVIQRAAVGRGVRLVPLQVAILRNIILKIGASV